MQGIYKITSLHDGSFYIGSSTNIEFRWKRHLSQLKYKKHSNIYIQRIYDKYGKDNLFFEVIELCDDVRAREQYYLDTLNPKLNINKWSTGGDMIENHPLKDLIREKQIQGTRLSASSLEMRKKRSDNAKIRFPNGPSFGKKFSNETKLKMRNKGTKIKIDDEIFPSFRAAAERYNTTHDTIKRRVLSTDFPNYSLIT